MSKKSRYSLGGNVLYREGQIGSTKEESWNPVVRIHSCCDSRQPSYHRTSCYKRSPNLDDITFPEKPKEVRRAEVLALKARGLTSIQVAEQLNIPLKEANMLWIG